MGQGFGAPVNGGAVDLIYDSEVPRSFTAIARTVISGGQFVVVSGGANVVGSIVSTFTPGSIVVDLLGADPNYVNGIALYNVASGAIVSVATRGTYIGTIGDAISGGAPVYAVSGTVQYLVAAIGVAGSVHPIGRAQSASASGTNNFAVVQFSF